MTHTCLHEPLLISKELCSFSLALHFGPFLTVDPRRKLVGRNGVDPRKSQQTWQWQTQPPTKNWFRIGGVSALIHPHVHFNLTFCCSPAVPPVRIISDKTGKFEWGHMQMNQYKPYMWAPDWDLDQCRLCTFYLPGLCQRQELVKMHWNVGQKRGLMHIGREKVQRSEPSINAVQQCTLLRGSHHQPSRRINTKTCLKISCLKIHSGHWNRNHFNEEMQLGIRLLLRRHTVAAIATIGSTPNAAARKRQGYNTQSQKATARITETIGQWP